MQTVNLMKSFKAAVLAATLALSIFACSKQHSASSPTSVKNLILLIGDGMGPQQIALAVAYSRHVSKTDLNIFRLMQEGEVGAVMPDGATNLVIDSACSATQMATGIGCRPEMLGLDASGNRTETILEKAKAAGKSAGLVSDTRITHATPAAFASHVIHRRYENEIAEQLIESGTDVLLSGGLRTFIPSAAKSLKLSLDKRNFSKLKSTREDDLNLLERAQSLGYDLAFDKSKLESSRSNKILGLFAPSGMPDAIEMLRRRRTNRRTMPALKEMTGKAIEVLSRNPNGFFLMVEGGQIDWAGHENDAGRMLHEMLRFDEALGVVYDWAKGRDDTLVVVTADHETGSFGFSYSARDIPEAEELRQGFFGSISYQPRYNFGRRENLAKLFAQKRTLLSIVEEFEGLDPIARSPQRLASMIRESTPFSLSAEQARDVLAKRPNRFYVEGHSKLGHRESPVIKDFAAFYPYLENNRVNLIARAIADQQDVVWGTGTHTSVPVLVVAYGPKKLRQAYDGFQQMTDIGKLLAFSMGLDHSN